MKTLLYHLLLLLLSPCLIACDDNDEGLTPAGTAHTYQTYEVEHLEDGTYVIGSHEKYYALMNATLPRDINIDFSKSRLVIVKSHENQGITDITAAGNTDNDTYRINVTIKLNGTLPVLDWGVAVVTPRIDADAVNVTIDRAW